MKIPKANRKSPRIPIEIVLRPAVECGLDALNSGVYVRKAVITAYAVDRCPWFAVHHPVKWDRSCNRCKPISRDYLITHILTGLAFPFRIKGLGVAKARALRLGRLRHRNGSSVWDFRKQPWNWANSHLATMSKHILLGWDEAEQRLLKAAAKKRAGAVSRV